MMQQCHLDSSEMFAVKLSENRRFWCIPILAALILSGCGHDVTPSAQNVEIVTPRRVTLAAHLDGDMESDPVLSVGEQILIVPASEEPFETHKEIHVHLPETTPYSGRDEAYFLHGYAVGQSSEADGQIAGHSNTSQAKRVKAWNDGWVKGFTDREQQPDIDAR